MMLEWWRAVKHSGEYYAFVYALILIQFWGVCRQTGYVQPKCSQSTAKYLNYDSFNSLQQLISSDRVLGDLNLHNKFVLQISRLFWLNKYCTSLSLNRFFVFSGVQEDQDKQVQLFLEIFGDILIIFIYFIDVTFYQ